MKCELIRDLLPLYIDGLTSEESNREIEKHLKNCKECRVYYQEMKGEIPETESVSEEEIEDAGLIKKIKKKRKRRIAAAITGTAIILMVAAAILLPRAYGDVKYEDVTLNYGTRGTTAYLQITVKPGRGIVFTGENTKDGMYLKVLSSHWVLNSERGTTGWEDELGSKDDPCKWTLEFKDKILVFENGELVQEKEK